MIASATPLARSETHKFRIPPANHSANRVRFYRLRHNMSQIALEMEIRAAAGTISRIESGKVNPTKETLYAIAAALRLRPHEAGDLLGIAH